MKYEHDYDKATETLEVWTWETVPTFAEDAELIFSGNAQRIEDKNGIRYEAETATFHIEIMADGTENVCHINHK